MPEEYRGKEGSSGRLDGSEGQDSTTGSICGRANRPRRSECGCYRTTETKAHQRKTKGACAKKKKKYIQHGMDGFPRIVNVYAARRDKFHPNTTQKPHLS